MPKLQTLTDEQELISEQIPSKRSNSQIQARAGTGKTFILKVLAAMFPKDQILYVTFSKELVEEAKKAGLPSNVEIRTAHSLAYSSAKKFYSPTKQLQLKDYFRNEAMFEYLDEPQFELNEDTEDDERQYRYELRKTMLDLVQYCKVNMVKPDDLDAVAEVIKYYGISADPVHIKNLPKCYKFSMKPSGNIGFTEMIHTPLYLGLPMPKFSIILADEIQDSSLMIMELYKECLAPGGFIVGVGDSAQAIYGFAGSRNDGMETFAKMFSCEKYNLTTNFRCGKVHIELAQTMVPDIRAHDNAIEGTLEDVNDIDFEAAEAGHIFECRTNAPLIGPCLRLVKLGKKANVKGRDIASPINAILGKVEKYDKNKALDKLIGMEESEMRIAEKRKYKKATMDSICDRYSIARDFPVDSDDVKSAKRKLYNIFADETPGIVFTSCHKAKGLEADHVTILNYDDIRISRNDMQEWQREQEVNLNYVAVTRAKQSLTLVRKAQKNEEDN